MPENEQTESVEKHFSEELTPEAKKHPLFRTQTEKDKLNWVFDLGTMEDTEDIRDGNKKGLPG